MSEQPPVPQPEQPSHQPTSQPPTPPTQPMSAAEGAPPAGPAGPTAGPTSPGSAAGPPFAGSAAGPPAPPSAAGTPPVWGDAPRPNAWQRTTSTSGGRWGLAIAAVGLASLMIFVAAIAGVAILRHHDRVGFLGQRQEALSRGQDGPGDNRGLGRGNGFGNGQGPGANGPRNGQRQPGMPGMPGGRAQGLGGLGNLLGGTALHGEVTATINGSVQPLLFQRGEVTAVSDTSISLKSSDGFVGTYGRTGATVSRGVAPVKGGQAFVLARASDKVAITTVVTRANAGGAPSS
jgi:hypothetical protein